jgi:hypothetical protein
MTLVADAETGEVKAGPVGIGGWLYLPIIGFAGTILLSGSNLLSGLKDVDGLRNILVATGGPLAQLKAPLIADLGFGLAVMASAAYCLYLIATKRRRIVNMATVHYGLLICGALAEVWVDGALRAVLPSTPVDPSVFTQVVRVIFIAAIWIPYFRASARVKNTFVN